MFLHCLKRLPCPRFAPCGDLQELSCLSFSLSVSMSQQELFAHVKSGALSAGCSHQSSANFEDSRENSCRSFCAEGLPLMTHLSCHGSAGQAQMQEECAVSVLYCPALLPRHAFWLTAPSSDCSKNLNRIADSISCEVLSRCSG